MRRDGCQWEVVKEMTILARGLGDARQFLTLEVGHAGHKTHWAPTINCIITNKRLKFLLSPYCCHSHANSSAFSKMRQVGIACIWSHAHFLRKLGMNLNNLKLVLNDFGVIFLSWIASKCWLTLVFHSDFYQSLPFLRRYHLSHNDVVELIITNTACIKRPHHPSKPPLYYD